MDERTNGHTKRSVAFQAKIDRLIELIRSPSGMLTVNDEAEIADILERHTTDSACMVKAADDEPVFVLRGQDVFASACVIRWADLCDSAMANISNLGNIKPVPKAKILDARACAEQMRRYPNRRTPD